MRIKTIRQDYVKVKPKNMKFYHASPVRFRAGDILKGGCTGGSGYRHPNVCLHTSPVPHGTIASRIPGWAGYIPNTGNDFSAPSVQDRDWFVYEVVPVGKVCYVHGNREYQSKKARVVKVVGLAKAFLAKVEPFNPEFMAFEPRAQKERMKKRTERQVRHRARKEREGNYDY